MTKTEPRSAGSGGGRDKTQPTSTELLAQRLRDHAQVHDDLRHMDEEQQQWSDDLREAAELLTTLSAREDGWQPIETAPKDRLIDIFYVQHSVGTRICDAYYDSICGEWRTSRPAGQLVCIREQFATHWRDKPESPKAPTAGEGK